jgi:hypothetical protein
VCESDGDGEREGGGGGEREIAGYVYDEGVGAAVWGFGDGG